MHGQCSRQQGQVLRRLKVPYAREPYASLVKDAFIEALMDVRITVVNEGYNMDVCGSILEKYFVVF